MAWLLACKTQQTCPVRPDHLVISTKDAEQTVLEPFVLIWSVIWRPDKRPVAMAKAQCCLLLLGALLCTATSQPDHEQDRRGKQPMLMKNQLPLLHGRLDLGLVAMIHIMVLSLADITEESG